MLNNNYFEIATDGSYSPKTDTMGWSFVCKNEESKFGGSKHGTNQIGELTAIYEAVNTYISTPNILIYSDSEYCIKSLTLWIDGWKAKGWKNSSKKQIENYNLITSIDKLFQQRNEIFSKTPKLATIRFEWVKGHAGHPLNEKADDLAQAAMLSYADKDVPVIPKCAEHDVMAKPHFQQLVDCNCVLHKNTACANIEDKAFDNLRTQEAPFRQETLF